MTTWVLKPRLGKTEKRIGTMQKDASSLRLRIQKLATSGSDSYSKPKLKIGFRKVSRK
jgi:hypothetical protein